MFYFLGTKPVDNVQEEEGSRDTRELSGQDGNGLKISHPEKVPVVDVLTQRAPDSHSLKSQSKGRVRQQSFSYEGRAKSLCRQRNSLHTGKNIFKCESCHKSFSLRSNLVTHLRMHTGEKSYACDLCSKTFAQSHHLTDHKRTHTGEKPYACDLCPKSFAHCNTLSYHRRSHTGEKSFQCLSCPNSFRSKCNLMNHTKSHTR